MLHELGVLHYLNAEYAEAVDFFLQVSGRNHVLCHMGRAWEYVRPRTCNTRCSGGARRARGARAHSSRRPGRSEPPSIPHCSLAVYGRSRYAVGAGVSMNILAGLFMMRSRVWFCVMRLPAMGRLPRIVSSTTMRPVSLLSSILGTRTANREISIRQ